MLEMVPFLVDMEVCLNFVSKSTNSVASENFVSKFTKSVASEDFVSNPNTSTW